MRLDRSAPENPGVRIAMTSTETSSARGLFLLCTAKIALRPAMSGTSTCAGVQDTAGSAILPLCVHAPQTGCRQNEKGGGGVTYLKREQENGGGGGGGLAVQGVC